MQGSPRPSRRLTRPTRLQAVAAVCLIALPCLGRAETLTAFAGVEPVRYLAQSVGGVRVSVRVLVPPGQSPHTFEPTPHQLAGLESADFYFAVGMPFEAGWVPRLRKTAPGLTVVHLAGSAEPATHDPAQADPHPWTDPLAAVELAQDVRDALVEADARNRQGHEERFQALARSLRDAHRQMERLLAPYRGRAFVVYHPAWSALAGRYDLRQLAVEAGGKSPGARHLTEVIGQAREEGVCAVFVQPQFSTRAAERVAEALDVPVVALDPLAGDLPKHLPEVARTLARYLERPCPR